MPDAETRCATRRLRYSIRFVLLITAIAALYFGFARVYGFGRAILCLLFLIAPATSLVFFASAWHSLKEEHYRHALASLVIALLIFTGAVLSGWLVFQPIVRVEPDSLFF